MEAAGMNWRKASYSANGGECVETASGSGMVLVRDTTNRTGGMLIFSSGSWAAFVAQVRG